MFILVTRISEHSDPLTRITEFKIVVNVTYEQNM